MAVPEKTLIVIAGPTGVGKTDLSLQLAAHFQTAIISADSRQCYREMTIGTAQPSPEALKRIPHYFINSHSVTQNLNAADFEELALQYLGKIYKDNNVAVLCGGTGLYIRAVLEGIDPMPQVNETLQKQVEQDFQQHGMAWLQDELRRKDPDFFEHAEQQNPSRLIRALSFFLSHQQSITRFRTGIRKERDFKAIKIALTLPREKLYQRIGQRTALMMQEGLMEEVKILWPQRHLKNLRTVGYQELFDYLDGQYDLETAISRIQQHSRNYAKRQLTWFRKDPEWQWFPPDAHQEILDFILAQLPDSFVDSEA